MKGHQRIAQLYVLFAFPLWKSVLLYIHGADGLSLSFRSSFWSLAVFAGYALSTVLLLVATVRNARHSTRKANLILEPSLFAAIGFLFIWSGLGLPSGTSHFIGTVTSIVITLVILSLTWRAGRRYQVPAFYCWFFAYTLYLIQALVSITFQWPQQAPPVWWAVRFLESIRDQGRWIPLLTLMIQVSSSVLIAMGMILLIQRLENRSRMSAWSVVQRGVMVIALLLISTPVFTTFLTSASLVPIVLTNAVIFGLAFHGYRKLKISAFAFWCWASALTLVLTITSFWPAPLRQIELNVPLALISKLFLLGGIVMMLPELRNLMVTPPKCSFTKDIRQAPKGLSPVQRLLIITGVGGIAIATVWLSANGLERLSPEPKYEGHTLSYYMQHWYAGPYSSQVSAETRAAIQSMGAKALPYLLKSVTTPLRKQSQDRSHALQAFRILGSAAAPAIPELVKAVEDGQGYPAIEALSAIGPAAVPALTNLLLRELNATNATRRKWFKSGWDDRRPRFILQGNILEALEYIDIPAAIPAVLAYLQDDRAKFRGRAALTLARIGADQPELIVPALVAQLPGSSNQFTMDLADALNRFGTRARLAVPALFHAQQTSDPYVRLRIARSLKMIAPEMPGLLAPLLDILRSPKASDRKQALSVLQSMGTNATEAMPEMSRVLKDPDLEVRVAAEQTIREIGLANSEIISALVENLSHENPGVSSAAVTTLKQFAGTLPAAFSALLIAANTPNRAFQDQCWNALAEVSKANPTLLLGYLESTNEVPRYSSLAVLARLRVEVPEAVPLVVTLLHDPIPEVRDLATNVLQLQSPSAARSLGLKPRWER